MLLQIVSNDDIKTLNSVSTDLNRRVDLRKLCLASYTTASLHSTTKKNQSPQKQ